MWFVHSKTNGNFLMASLVQFGQNPWCTTGLVIPQIAKDSFYLGTLNIFLLINFSLKVSLLFSHMTPSSCDIEKYVIDEEP